MKSLIMIPLALALTACGAGGGGATTTAVADPLPAVTPTPQPQASPLPAPTPSPAPSPVPAPSPTPSPAPAPTPLACFSNNGALCTGASLGATFTHVDLVATFGLGPGLNGMFVQSILNGQFASRQHTACPQPSTAGCYHDSVCITVEYTPGGLMSILCGNDVDASNVLVMR